MMTITPTYDKAYFDAMEIMDKEDRKTMIGNVIPVDKLTTGATIRHTQAADREAFNDLFTKMQEIEKIVIRATREGQRGYKLAIEKIKGICQGIE